MTISRFPQQGANWQGLQKINRVDKNRKNDKMEKKIVYLINRLDFDKYIVTE